VAPAVVALVLVAGLSEAVGRLLPVIARRPRTSPPLVVGLLATGTVVEAGVITLWPLTAWALAERVPGAGGTVDDPGLAWTAGALAPLVLAGVLAFPLIGPLLHLVLLVGVGSGLAGALATSTGLGWAAAAGCVAAAAAGLALSVAVVRRGVVAVIAPRRREPVP
jgi:hypothetical protein